MNGTIKLRLALLSLGFGVALLFAPSAQAQAESSPDHFTETGVETGPGGSVAPSAAHAVAAKQSRKKQAVAVFAAQASTSAAPVHVAVADKNRPAITAAPKQ